MLLALILGAWAQAEPHESFYKMPTANGHGVAVFNGRAASGAVLDRFSDHLYQQYSAGSEPVRDLLYDSYFGLRVGGEGGWLTSAEGWGVEVGTNIIYVTRRSGELELTEWVLAPMDLAWPGFVHLLSVRNAGSEETEELEAFALMNFHVGDETWQSEALSVAGDGRVSEWGSNTGLRFDYVPLVAPDGVGCSPDNPWAAVNEGRDLGGCAAAAGDDLVAGFQWSLGRLQPGETRWVGQADLFALGREEDLAARVQAYVDGRSPETLVEAERAWWAAWAAEGALPGGLSADEEAVARQALAFLKMSQVREAGDAYGQLLASMPLASDGTFSHLWNIAWVRDGAYGVMGLLAAGHLAEARDALAFQIQPGKTGAYRDYVRGYDHALSICRIYGDGSEWTDDDGTGPNIEFDNFGLYLWAFGSYLRASGDLAFLETHHEAVLDRTADVLVGLIDEETGLITADSSIWERHWEGHQKRFTYTSTWAVRGLREAAWMAEQLGEPERALGYRRAAAGIRDAISEHLIRGDGALAGNLEELAAGQPSLDLAAVDAFNNGTLPTTRSLFDDSMSAWESLRVASGHGFARNDDGDLYDRQEWVMIDLRLAEALDRVGRDEEARALDDWITAQATQNRLILPELLSEDAGDYAGPAPMMGFGSGLYVWRMRQRGEPGFLELPEGGDTGDSQLLDTAGDMPWPSGDSGSEADKDCGCASGPRGGLGGAWALIALISGMCRRRRG